MKILNDIYISGSGSGDSLLVQISTASSNLTINSWTSSNQDLFKIKNNPTYSLSNFYVRGTSSLSLSATESFLYLDYSPNIMSISNDGLFSLNGTIQFRDINFLTQSFATNSNMRGNVNGFILHNGKLINSPWFSSNQFSSNGSFFWMEPGYSRTWQTYSPLGDVKKLTFTASGFTAGSLISFRLDAGLTYSALTYSDIFNISVNSDNRTIYPAITKSFSSNRVFLNVDTFTDNVNNLELTVLGRNMNFINYTELPSVANILSMYALNTRGVTYSLTIENQYFSRTTFTLSPGVITRILYLRTLDSNWISGYTITNNNSVSNFYVSYFSNLNYSIIANDERPVNLIPTYYNFLVSGSITVGASAGQSYATRPFVQETNQLFLISGINYQGGGGGALQTNTTRWFIINTTNITQSVLLSIKPLNTYETATYSLTISANTNRHFSTTITNDSNSYGYFFIRNQSAISATFSLKAYYNINNYTTFTSYTNAPIPHNLTSSTNNLVFNSSDFYLSPGTPNTLGITLSGTQSAVYIHLHNGGTAGTFTASFTLPLAITYSTVGGYVIP